MKFVRKYTIGFIRLSRFRVILVDYFWILVILSIIATGLGVSLVNYVIAIVAAFLVHAYGFIVNDCEDADDDAQDPKKAARNPISSGFLSYKEGIIILQFTSFPAMILGFLVSGWIGALIIFSAIIAGHLYSWKKIRLKNIPFIDLVSHSYFLSMFQVIFFLTLPGAIISLGSILIIYGLGLFSAGGALYNQIRDYEVDRKTNIKNTTSILGKKNSRIFGLGLYILGVILIVSGMALRLFIS